MEPVHGCGVYRYPPVYDPFLLLPKCVPQGHHDLGIQAVNISYLVVVTEDGSENFTSGAPLELDDVEALMRDIGSPGHEPKSLPYVR